MIVYTARKSKFLDDVLDDQIHEVIHREFQRKLFRKAGQSEVNSWRNSMKEMRQVLNDPDIPDDSLVSIEYNIPLTGKRIDFILTGRNAQLEECAVIIELKQWSDVQATGQDDRDLIELRGESGDWDKDRRVATRADLIGIIRPRVTEILEEVRARLDVAGFDHLPSQQIVLTGGASQIPGLDGLAARILGQQVRLGRPIRVPGLPQATTGPEYSALVGLCQFAAAPQDEWWDFDIPAQRFAAKPLKRAMKWFRDNW